LLPGKPPVSYRSGVTEKVFVPEDRKDFLKTLPFEKGYNPGGTNGRDTEGFI
jgi:hypothetical protein